MQVSIQVADRVIGIDGLFLKVDADWSPFDHVHAVQAWPDRDRAEIEFREIDPDGDGPLPSVKPPNQLIDGHEFVETFGALMQAYHAQKSFLRVAGVSEVASAELTAPVATAIDSETAALILGLKARIEEAERVIEIHKSNFQSLIAKATGQP